MKLDWKRMTLWLLPLLLLATLVAVTGATSIVGGRYVHPAIFGVGGASEDNVERMEWIDLKYPAAATTSASLTVTGLLPGDDLFVQQLLTGSPSVAPLGVSVTTNTLLIKYASDPGSTQTLRGCWTRPYTAPTYQ